MVGAVSTRFMLELFTSAISANLTPSGEFNPALIVTQITAQARAAGATIVRQKEVTQLRSKYACDHADAFIFVFYGGWPGPTHVELSTGRCCQCSSGGRFGSTRKLQELQETRSVNNEVHANMVSSPNVMQRENLGVVVGILRSKRHEISVQERPLQILIILDLHDSPNA